MNPTIKARIESIRRGEVPEGYKRTKIGIMPNEWGISKIGSVSERIIPGATPSTSVKKYWDGNIRWMSSGEIHNRFIYNTKSNITKEGYEVCSTTILPTHCVLIALAGQGKTRGCVAVNEVELCTNQSIAALVPKDIYYLYLFFYLESKYLELRKISSGDGTRGGLNISLLNGFQIAIPAHPEQEKIAEILAGQDRVIALKEKLLAEKQKQKKYLMQQLLTGKKRLPGFSGEWKEGELGDIVLECNDGSTPSRKNDDFFNGDINWVVVEDIRPYIYSTKEKLSKKGVESANLKVWKRGTVIISTCASIGLVGILCCEAATKQGITAILVNEDNSNEYVRFWLENEKSALLKFAQGSSIREIRSSILLKLKIDYPCLQEQKAIVKILLMADKEIELLKKDIGQEKLKKKSLMQLLLTGIVRVKDV